MIVLFIALVPLVFGLFAVAMERLEAVALGS